MSVLPYINASRSTRRRAPRPNSRRGGGELLAQFTDNRLLASGHLFPASQLTMSGNHFVAPLEASFALALAERAVFTSNGADRAARFQHVTHARVQSANLFVTFIPPIPA